MALARAPVTEVGMRGRVFIRRLDGDLEGLQVLRHSRANYELAKRLARRETMARHHRRRWYGIPTQKRTQRRDEVDQLPDGLGLDSRLKRRARDHLRIAQRRVGDEGLALVDNRIVKRARHERGAVCGDVRPRSLARRKLGAPSSEVTDNCPLDLGISEEREICLGNVAWPVDEGHPAPKDLCCGLGSEGGDVQLTRRWRRGR